MPTYDITSPDGRKFRVTAPDGATQEEVMAYVQKQTAQKPAAPATDDPGFLGAAAISAGNWLDSKAAGLRGAVRDYVPGGESIVGAIDKLDTMRGVTPPSEQTRAAAAPAMAQLEQQRPGAMLAGSFLPDMAAKTPLGMALLGGLDPGTLGERSTRAGIGYAGGKAGEYIGGAVSRAMGPKVAGEGPKLADEFFPALGTNKWNIPLTVGQATQSRPAQITESVVANLPGGSGVMGKAHDRTFGAFNKAVSNTFGEDSTKLTPELLGAAKQRIGGVFNEVSARNAMKFDEPTLSELIRVQERAHMELTPDQANIVTKWTDNILRDINPDSEIAGKLYKAYDSQLGKLAKSSGGTLGDVLGDLRGVLRESMDKSISEADKAAWSTARKQYHNLQTVAAANAHTADGTLPIASLLQSVNRSQKNAKFGAGNDLADLAQWAKATLPDKIPNSGTAQRALYQKIITNPLTSIGALGGGAYGADSLGLGPGSAVAGVAVPYALARALAGKPSSAATEELLKRLGVGLLGSSALTYAR